jgi:hypothetical protein
MKPQTKRETLDAIRAAGMRGRWIAATDEFRVGYPPESGLDTEANAYYTDDAQDAINTARIMASQEKQ